MPDPKITLDLPARSIMMSIEFQGRAQNYCLLLYENVNDRISRQVVVLAVDMDRGLEGSIVGRVENLGDESWAHVTSDPAVWFKGWLKTNHRRIHGYPMPS